MMRLFKNLYWSHWLKKYQCKFASGVCNLGKMTILQIEPQVKLGRILVTADKVVISAYSYIRSGSELYGHCQIGRFCSIGQNVIIGLDKSKHPSNWLSTALFLEKYEREYIALTTPVTTTIKHDCWIGRDVVIIAVLP